MQIERTTEDEAVAEIQEEIYQGVFFGDNKLAVHRSDEGEAVIETKGGRKFVVKLWEVL
jgi:hypothetical protein